MKVLKGMKRSTWHSRKFQPSVYITLGIAVAFLVAAGAYETSTGLIAALQGHQKTTATEDAITEKASESKSSSATTQPKTVASNAPKAGGVNAGKLTSYDPRCTGAGCPTANAKYSIITTRSITVEAGSTVGPFTASTSNGWAVSWTTPSYLDGLGPNGYWLSNTGRVVAPSMKYYMRAEQNVPPGKYTVYMGAYHSATYTDVRAAITVTVRPYSGTTAYPQQTPSPDATPFPTPFLQAPAPVSPTPTPTW